jgi:hypothetical protein
VAKKLTLLGGLTALVCAVLLGVWLLTAPEKGVALRTDWVGLRVRIDVPRSWHRQGLRAGWVYLTGCEHLGIKPLRSTQAPSEVLLAIEPFEPYPVTVGEGFALIPGFEVRQVRPGIVAMILIDKPGCEDAAAVNGAINSLR